MAARCAKTRVVRYLCLGLATCLSAWSHADDGASPTATSPKVQAEFERLVQADWQEVFRDPGTKDWREHWFLDGQQAKVENSSQGMELTAGPEFKNDAHHMVLWTKQDFAGDLKIDYEYTRLDSENRCVNILYVQATGSGAGPYVKDITQWSELRAVPAMRTYFNHMHTYHVSYAAFPNDGKSLEDYIRARRYMPEANGLRETDLVPDYFQTGLFKAGVPHKITVIKCGQELYMHIRNDQKQMLCRWKNTGLPPILEGRIGLRHMYTRSARYRDFRISRRDSSAVPVTTKPCSLGTMEPAAEEPRLSTRQVAGLQKLLKKPYPGPGAWRCENTALASLSLNRQVPDGNAAILKVRDEYFDKLVHDDDGAVHGSFHWHAYLLARIYFLFNHNSDFFPGRLTPEAEDAILTMLWEWTHSICRLDMVSPERDLWKWGSENHHIQMFGSLWACLEIFARSEQYGQRSLGDGNSVREVSQAFSDYFKRFAAQRATRSLFIEFNSPTYTKYSLSPLYNMADFASDAELSRRIRGFLDVFWAQWAIEQIDGVRGGSRHRCYPGPASQRSAGGGDGFAWYHFGLGEAASIHPGVITAATTFYQPHAAITHLALQPARRGEYEIVNRLVGRWAGRDDLQSKAQYSDDPTSPLYQAQGVYVAAPEQIGIRRYTYCTPEFILGSSMVPALAADQWLAISSQNRWDWLTLGGNSQARIYVQCEKPSRGSVYNTHWSVQHKGVLVIQRLKAHAKAAKGNRIWIDQSLNVEESDGWVFAESPAAYAAVCVTDGAWSWEPPAIAEKVAGRWMVCENPFAPIVIEAAGKSRFASFEAFQLAVKQGAMENKGTEFRYTSRIYGTTLTLYTDWSSNPKIDGCTIDFRPKMAVDSPFLRAAYGGSTVELNGLDGTRVQYDFSNDSVQR